MLSNQTRPFYPSLAVLIGAILWGVVWYPMRLLEDRGLGALWLTFVIYAAALPYTVRSLGTLNRSPGWLTVLALAAGWPWPQSDADWFALSSGFAFALSNVATRAAQEVSIRAKIFCVWIGVTTLAVAMIALFAAPAPSVTPATIGAAVALGGIGIVAMTLLIQYGVTHLPVYRSAVITFVELIAGAVSQALLSDETVTTGDWIGGALIVLGAYASARTSAGNR